MMFPSLVGFVGVIIGVCISSYFTMYMNDEMFTRQDVISQQDYILNKRIELLERTAKVFNSTHIIVDTNNELKIHYKMRKHVDKCTKNPKLYDTKFIGCLSLINSKEAYEKRQVRDSILVEFGTLNQMNSAAFGEDTRLKALEIAKKGEWWLSDKAVFTRYIAAMRNELYQFQSRPNKVIKQD